MGNEEGGIRDERIAALFASAYEPMCRLAFVVVGDAGLAEEVVMDALVNLYRRWDMLDDVGSAEHYLRRAVINGCRSAIRSQSRARTKLRLFQARSAAPVDGPPAPMDRQLIGVVRDLPERQRACVALYYFEDLSVAEIAGLLECAEGTVKSQLSKARASIRTALEQPDD